MTKTFLRVLCLISLVLAGLLAPSLAEATVRWVAPNGLPGRTGADSANAISLNNANQIAVAGDTVRFKSGDYTGANPNDAGDIGVIRPRNNGTSTQRITYRGFPDDPTGVTINQVIMGQIWPESIHRGDYTTARWFTCKASLVTISHTYSDYCTGDSISHIVCNAPGATARLTGSGHVMDHCTLTATSSFSGSDPPGIIDLWVGGGQGAAEVYQTGNQIRDCTFNITVDGTGSNDVLKACNWYHGQIYNNDFNVVVNQCPGWFQGWAFYDAADNNIQNNRMSIILNSNPGTSSGWLNMRDYASRNRFMGNIIAITGSGGSLGGWIGNNGTYLESVRQNYYGYNSIRVASSRDAALTYWMTAAILDTIEFNVVAAEGTPVLYANSCTRDSAMVVRHNTFYTSGATTVQFVPTSSTASRMTSNIYYGRGTNATGSENVRVQTGMGLDSLGLVYNVSGDSTKALAINSASSRVGTGSPQGLVGYARWGNPLFTDATSTTNLNPVLQATSLALHPSAWDGYAGARGQASGSQTATTTTVTTSATPATYGTILIFTATVSPNPSSGPAVFTVDGVGYTRNVTGLGTVTLTIPTPNASATPYTVSVVYGGNTNFAGSSGSLAGGQTVNRAPTTTTLTGSSPTSSYLSPVTYTVQVNPAVSGQASIAVGGVAHVSHIAVSGGGGTATISDLGAGANLLTATFADTTNYATSTSGNLGILVSTAPTTVTVSTNHYPAYIGQSVTWSVLVTSTAGPVVGTVQFKLDGVNQGSPITLSTGSASYTTTAGVEGTYAVSVVYSDPAGNFVGNTGTLASGQLVTKWPVTSSVGTTGNPIASTGTATFCDTILPTPTGGTVQFSVDGVAFGSPVALTNGIAVSGAKSGLLPGAHRVDAVYSGDSLHFGITKALLGGQGVLAAVVTSSLTVTHMGIIESGPQDYGGGYAPMTSGIQASAGNMLVVFLQYSMADLGDGAVPVDSVLWGTTPMVRKVVSSIGPSINLTHEAWTLPVTASGTHPINVVISSMGSLDYLNGLVEKVGGSGLVVLDAMCSADGHTNAPSSGSVTTTDAPEELLGSVAFDGNRSGSFTAGTAYQYASVGGASVEDVGRSLGTAGAYATAKSTGSVQRWSAMTLTFKITSDSSSGSHNSWYYRAIRILLHGGSHK